MYSIEYKWTIKAIAVTTTNIEVVNEESTIPLVMCKVPIENHDHRAIIGTSTERCTYKDSINISPTTDVANQDLHDVEICLPVKNKITNVSTGKKKIVKATLCKKCAGRSIGSVC
jgi:hypothetical protein